MKPMSIHAWQRNGRRRWMSKAGVVKNRIVSRLMFRTRRSKYAVVVREYLLPDDTIVSEQYAYWQDGDLSRVMLIALVKVDSYRHMLWPIW